jgi:hypothetical protein
LLPAPTLRPFRLSFGRLGFGPSAAPTVAGCETGPPLPAKGVGRVGSADAVRGAKPLGCCRSVLSHRVAPLSADPSSDPAGANTCQPLRLGASAGRSCERAGRVVPGVASLRWYAPGQACAMPGRIPARGGVECCRCLFASAFAPDGDQSPCRASPQFRASADQPEGTCRLVTLQSLRVRIVVRFIPVNQRLGR